MIRLTIANRALSPWFAFWHAQTVPVGSAILGDGVIGRRAAGPLFAVLFATPFGLTATSFSGKMI